MKGFLMKLHLPIFPLADHAFGSMITFVGIENIGPLCQNNSERPSNSTAP